MSFFSGGRRQNPPLSGSSIHAPEPKTPPALPQSTHPIRQPVGFETVLGANSTLRGDLKSQANVRLDGIFEGNLEIEGNVLVGETG